MLLTITLQGILEVKMFYNLKAEMARKNVRAKHLSELLCISIKSVNNKLSGRTEFTLSEIMKISKVFHDIPTFELFERKEIA